jgi:hypothetical protein
MTQKGGASRLLLRDGQADHPVDRTPIQAPIDNRRQTVSPGPAACGNLANSLAGPRPSPLTRELTGEERDVARISAVIGYFLRYLY